MLCNNKVNEWHKNVVSIETKLNNEFWLYTNTTKPVFECNSALDSTSVDTRLTATIALRVSHIFTFRSSIRLTAAELVVKFSPNSGQCKSFQTDSITVRLTLTVIFKCHYIYNIF